MATTTGSARAASSAASSRVECVDPVDGVVGMEPHGGPHGHALGAAGPPGRRSDRARPTASAEDRPVPAHTSRETPASAARARVPASRSACGSTGPSPGGGSNSSWRWQCESNQARCRVGHRGQTLRRGKSGGPFSTGRTARVAAPGGVGRAAARRPGEPGRPMRRQSSAADDGMAGDHQEGDDPQDLEGAARARRPPPGRARPSRARSTRARRSSRRISRQVASSAIVRCAASQAADVAAGTSVATAASGLPGSGAGRPRRTSCRPP